MLPWSFLFLALLEVDVLGCLGDFLPRLLSRGDLSFKLSAVSDSTSFFNKICSFFGGRGYRNSDGRSTLTSPRFFVFNRVETAVDYVEIIMFAELRPEPLAASASFLGMSITLVALDLDRVTTLFSSSISNLNSIRCLVGLELVTPSFLDFIAGFPLFF